MFFELVSTLLFLYPLVLSLELLVLPSAVFFPAYLDLPLGKSSSEGKKITAPLSASSQTCVYISDCLVFFFKSDSTISGLNVHGLFSKPLTTPL